MTYSEAFRESAVKKLFDPNCSGLKPLAKELGIMPHTLRKWRDRIVGDIPNKGATMGKKRPQDWSANEKFQAVMETAALNDLERSEYCRRNGLYTELLDLWKEQCLASMRKGPKVDVEKKQLKMKNKELVRELHRKDKALAETTALLVLKKKADLIFGRVEDEDS